MTAWVDRDHAAEDSIRLAVWQRIAMHTEGLFIRSSTLVKRV